MVAKSSADGRLQARSTVPDLFRPEFVSWVEQAVDTYDAIRNEHPVTFAAVRQSQWHHSGVFALEEAQLEVRCPFLDNDFVQTVYRAPRSETSAMFDSG